MQAEKDKGLRDDSWLSRNLGWALLAIVTVAAAMALVTMVTFRAHFGGDIVGTTVQEWGTVGDFFGGLLNPVFGFLTIVALVLTLLLQSKELKMSREELEMSRKELEKSAEALKSQNKAIELQSFEQTFFAWLATYREILGEVTGSSGERGRNALNSFWKVALSDDCRVDHDDSAAVFTAKMESLLFEAWHEIGDINFDSMTPADHLVITKGAEDEWERLYHNQENQLDSLFRVLYRLLCWIDLRPQSSLSAEQKWLYVSIVRSQLSWIEMVYLFYNGHTNRGEKFKPLIEKYALFDNLTFESDCVLALYKNNPPNHEGYRPSAYSSDVARAALGLQGVA